VNKRLVILPAVGLALGLVGSLAAVRAQGNGFDFYLATSGPVPGVKFSMTTNYVERGKFNSSTFPQAFDTTNITKIQADPGTNFDYAYPATVISNGITYHLYSEADPSGVHYYSGSGPTNVYFTLPAADTTIGIRGTYQ
jgi:hypothetical protein